MVKSKRNKTFLIVKLISLLGSFSFIVLLAIITGTIGFLSSISIMVFGALGIAKFLGASITLSYEAIIVLTIISGVARGLLRYLEQYFNHYIAFKLLQILRNKIFSKLRQLGPSSIEMKKKGNLISMLTSDIETIEVFYAHTISPIAIAFLVSIVIVVFIGLVSTWQIMLVVIFAFLTIGIILPIIYSKFMKRNGTKYREKLASFNSYFIDSIKGIKEIVIHANEKKREEKVNELSKDLTLITTNQKKRISLSIAITELIVSLFVLIGVIVGLFEFYNSSLSLEFLIVSIVTFMSSFGPVLALSNLPGNLSQTFASANRIFDLLEEEPTVKEIKNGVDFSFLNLEIKNLSFSYGGKRLLNQINLTAKKGEIVGIIGESGSGKTTLLNLILRFYKKDSGEILFNGNEIENINSSSLLNNVSLLSQNTYLFNETIYENLTLANENCKLNDVIDATRKANIYRHIMSIKDGFKSEVTMFGENFSSGEKQRLGLARCFLKQSKLILLDEPTSNVDSINEGLILSSILEAKKEAGVILVSHRESTMAIADRIYKLEKGSLKEMSEDERKRKYR